MLPDCSDWYARKPSGTTKNTASQSTPGASSRYGVSPRWRWKKLKRPSAGDQVLPLSQVLLIVQRLVVEQVHAVEHLLRREDERVACGRWVELLRRLARSRDRRDVVDAGDVAFGIAGLHQALHLRVVDVV